MTRKRTAVIAAVTGLGLASVAGVAVASGVVPGDDLTRPGSLSVEESAFPDDDAGERDALAELATVAQQDAEAAAVDSVGGGQALGSELEEEDGFVVWEVEVQAEDGSVSEVAVDAGNAEILGSERDDEDDDGRDDEDSDDEDDDRDDVTAGSLPVQETALPADRAARQQALADLATVEQLAAEQAALDAAGAGTVARSELEEEDGFVVWEVHVSLDGGGMREVIVDAGNGSVLLTETEDDDD